MLPKIVLTLNTVFVRDFHLNKINSEHVCAPKSQLSLLKLCLHQNNFLVIDKI